ncbi:MAG: hypothetical protein FJ009_03220 [Chloroflexi bacterium]|nr:hypothetical protein [Chloroflexota bacterium]
MPILELVLLSTAILLSAGSALLLRAAVQKNHNAGLKLRDTEQKYHQEREARDSAEDALRRAEDERRESERKLEQAQEALQAAEKVRQQAQAEVHSANDARMKAEMEQDAAKEETRQAKEDRAATIRAKEQAEQERDAAFTRAQVAEQAKARAEQELDAVGRQRDEADQARRTAEETARRAVQAKLNAEEQARLALQRAEESKKQAEDERDAVNERALRAEEMQKQAQENLLHANQAKGAAEERARRFENEARLANESTEKAGERARLAEQARINAEHERDIARRECEEANQARGIAEDNARLANERAIRAEELQKQSEEHRLRTIQDKEAAIKRAENAEHERDAAIRRADQTEKEQKRTTKVLERAKKRRRNCSTPAERKGKRSRYKHPSIQFAPRLAKPGIVCRDRNLEWELAVELPDDWLTDTEEPQVQQGDSLLEQEHDLWELKDLRNRITVRSGDKSWEIRLDEREDDYLLFKLSGYDLRYGTRVRSINRGAYLIVVPEAWDRADTNLGSKPEALSIEGYLAYYYVIDRPCKIAFRTPDGNSVEIAQSTTQFELVGNCLPDADEEGCPLFGDALPQIRATNTNAWETVKTIAVGEEGRERKSWKSILITPTPNRAEQGLPNEILGWQASWIFLRFYDENYQLIESADFRLARGLSKIQCNQAYSLPDKNGHSAALVEFHHTTGCVIKSASGIDIVSDGNTTFAEMPASIAFDKTDWEIAPQGHEPIDVTILVERIWWTIGTADKVPAESEWSDKVLQLARTDFDSNSSKVLWIRFPKPRWTNEVLIGFTKEAARPFPVKVAEQLVVIPLCSFESSEPRFRIGVSQFGIWVANSNASLAAMRVQAKCKRCDCMADSMTGFLNHVESHHLDTILQPLTYDEHVKRNPNLTVGLVVCQHSSCRLSWKAHWILDSNASSRAICQHAECKNVDHSVDSDGLANLIKEHIQQKHDAYSRANHSPHLIPDIRKCTLCGWTKESPSLDHLRHHLKEHHLNTLYELC